MTSQARSYFRFLWLRWKPAVFAIPFLILATLWYGPSVEQDGWRSGIYAFGFGLPALVFALIECKRRLLIIQWNERLCVWLNHNSVAGINGNNQTHGGIHDGSVSAAHRFIRMYPWLINNISFEWGDRSFDKGWLVAHRGMTSIIMSAFDEEVLDAFAMK